MELSKFNTADYLKIFENGENIALKCFFLRFEVVPHIVTVNIKINFKEFHDKITNLFGDQIELITDEQKLYADSIFSTEKKSDYILKNNIIIVASSSANEINILYSDESIDDKNSILQLINESKYVKPMEVCFHMVVSSDNLLLRKMELDKKNKYDINLLYNNDLFEGLPKIDSFIQNDSTGLMLFHGIPGSGKTNFIKELIRRHPDQSFIYIPNKLFSAIDSIEFINFFIENKNSILIIEDAEALLVDREKGNFSISTLLNLTEGLLGEALKIKVICTFNCEISKIDKALTRKGRLKFIYEFKPLKKEKVNQLFRVLEIDQTSEIDLPISDIFHFTFNNGFIVESKKSIGFNK